MKTETLNVNSGKPGILAKWADFRECRPGIAEFILFSLLSKGVTLFQLFMMPFLKKLFIMTAMVDYNFQILPLGNNFDGSAYYMFNYASGSLQAGGGGGLAYFLAVQLTIGLAQIINFFAQRNISFKSNCNIMKAAKWYFVAYVGITITAAALQGIYKAPVYNLLINSWGWGARGETTADVITMVINSLISFWLFYPIFKVIFKKEKKTRST